MAEPVAQPVARTEAPDEVPRVEPATSGSDPVRKSVPKPRTQNRRRKLVRIVNIYRDPAGGTSAPQLHAAALFDLIRDLSDDHGGQYVPKSQLQRMYVEECRRREWAALHWTAIGRE